MIMTFDSQQLRPSSSASLRVKAWLRNDFGMLHDHLWRIRLKRYHSMYHLILGACFRMEEQ